MCYEWNEGLWKYGGISGAAALSIMTVSPFTSSIELELIEIYPDSLKALNNGVLGSDVRFQGGWLTSYVAILEHL